ncbi:N-acetylmuramoyl-L-alanine amidase [Rhodoplanes sp. Z2-YC6860]|uniref:N-acetylmuramoyl-L-alanine amidase n=1 Tax=Rhodoplanes sp. Z2-YC6860 TaxID=674703 RepID=UPI00078DAC64|nr:N-acetylmuramoyl-L-alanine amidase [Rhodoplanes sp. Z2-YC6860]AMN42792.1 N-acetylmuramoyl-L-alanine amidase [Rhodoplanes sp. Z2-YC6860]
MAFRARDLIILVLSVMLLGAETAPSAGQDAGRPLAPFPIATDARVGGDDGMTRFVMDFSRKVDLRAFTLADPYRVVIDLPQVTFNLPPKIGDTGRGLVKAFRFGLVMQGGSRIVLDVGKPVRIEKAFSLDAQTGQPARVVIDLAGTDRDSFMKTVSVEKPALRTGSTSAPEEQTPELRHSTGDPRPIVVIDPGHGGIDNGTVSASGVMEKQIVLDFALLLRDRLEASGKYRVVMTRTDDTFIPLGDRVRMARIRQASLFISIHADALKKGEGEAQGATIYTLSEKASDAEAARLAENENRADVIAGIDLSHESTDVADILIDLAQRETKAFSMRFAKSVAGSMRKVARMHKNPMKSAGFKVLKAPDVPSVLIELGYVSDQADLKQLVSGSWQAKTAGAIAQSVDAFFGTRVAGAGAGPSASAAPPAAVPSRAGR